VESLGVLGDSKLLTAEIAEEAAKNAEKSGFSAREAIGRTM